MDFSPWPELVVRVTAGDSALHAVELNPEDRPEHPCESAHPVLSETVRQLQEYFSGRLRAFDLPLEMAGTEFQKRVWRALQEIPYAQTRTYGQIATGIGAPRAVRAVGAANGRNPLPIVVPCHRVIGANGKLVGFGGGVELKRRLLDLETGFACLGAD